MRRVVVFATMFAAGVAHAQVPDVRAVCVANCGTDSSTTSQWTAEDQARHQAELDAQFAADLDGALHAGTEERRRTLRRANEKAIAAAKQRKWALAIQYLEGALRLDPGNPLLTENLRQAREKALEDDRRKQQEAAQKRRAEEIARRENELERKRQADNAYRRKHARELVDGPVTVYNGTPEQIGARMSGRMAASAPDAFAFLANARELLLGRAREDLESGVKDMIDVTTAEGLWLRIQGNTVKLASAVPEWISAAASGELSVEDARLLDLKAATILFDVGNAPHELAQKIVDAKSAAGGVAAYSKEKLTALMNDGVSSLAAGLGATVTYPGGAPVGEPASLWDSVQWKEMQKELAVAASAAAQIRQDLPNVIRLWTEPAKGAPP